MGSGLTVVEGTFDELPAYEAVSIAFEVRRVLELEPAPPLDLEP